MGMDRVTLLLWVTAFLLVKHTRSHVYITSIIKEITVPLWRPTLTLIIS